MSGVDNGCIPNYVNTLVDYLCMVSCNVRATIELTQFIFLSGFVSLPAVVVLRVVQYWEHIRRYAVDKYD